jgi:hypothetical protein
MHTWFKYADYAIGNVNPLYEWSWPFPLPHVRYSSHGAKLFQWYLASCWGEPTNIIFGDLRPLINYSMWELFIAIWVWSIMIHSHIMNIVDGGFLEPNRLKNVHIHGHKLDCPHFMAFSGGEHDVCPQPCRASQGLSNGSTGRPAERPNVWEDHRKRTWWIMIPNQGMTKVYGKTM